jgi:alpha-tubulin suppressor-like RCC1 family protein
MPNEFLSPEGDIENYFVTEYWLIDQYIGDQLWTWGSGSNGRLGNGVTVGSISTPVTTSAGGSNWKQVNIGGSFTSAIKTDGTLWLWGIGVSGKLGNGVTTGNISTPVTTFAGGTDWKQVSGTTANTSAIKTDGTLWTWGSGSVGNLGNGVITGNISTPVTTFAGGTDWKQVSAGSSNIAAIKTDGTLWTWGSAANGQLGNGATSSFVSLSTPITTFAGGSNWKQVSSGGAHAAAIKTDGTLWTWGNTVYGKLGNAVASGFKSTPVTTFAGGTDWKQVSCGGYHTAAIKTDGTLWTWGSASNGKLGNATATGDMSTPVTTFAGGTDWKQVSAGSNNIAAIKTDGTLWSWGYAGSSLLGNAVGSGNISTPVTTFAGGTDWKQVSTRSDNTGAVQSGIGGNDAPPPPPPDPAWSGDIITASGNNTTTSPNICNIYFRRHIIMWVYTSAELQSALGTTSATISGLRFDVTQQPLYQPLPNYAIGMKNGSFGGGTPGHTGYTIVKSASSESFTTGTTKTFSLTTSFNWTGDDLAIIFAWGQCPTNWNSSGTSPIGSGTLWFSLSDSAGTYTINVDNPTSTRTYRPVVQLEYV